MVPGPGNPHKVTSGLSSFLPINWRSPMEALPPWVIAGPFYMVLHVMVRMMDRGHHTASLISLPPSQQVTGVHFTAGKHRKELNLLHTEMIRVCFRYWQLSLVFMILANRSAWSSSSLRYLLWPVTVSGLCVLCHAIQYSAYFEFRPAEMSDISLMMSFFPTEWPGKQQVKKNQGGKNVY